MRGFVEQFVERGVPVIPVLLPGLTTRPTLPPFLRAFTVADLTDLSDDNPRPLANLVAGILVRRPGEMQHDGLAEQVTAILKSPSTLLATTSDSVKVTEYVKVGSTPPETLPTVVLPVNRPGLSPDELDAVVQQTAQLLGISSRAVRLVRTEKGSVRVVLQLDDMIALSQLFSMAHKGDPNLVKFFHRCQISIDEFQTANEDVPPKLAELRKEEKARQPDELDQKVGKVSTDRVKEWSGGANVATLAVVFTDIVDSTKLCYDLGDATWDSWRQLHFARVQQLIAEASGCFIKNTGDGVLAAFHNADDAVTFSRDIVRNTGHAVIRVRAGAHIGQVTIDSTTRSAVT